VLKGSPKESSFEPKEGSSEFEEPRKDDEWMMSGSKEPFL